MLGRPRTTELRDVVDALIYVASTGCQWRQLPKDFPPHSTVQGNFYRWAEAGSTSSVWFSCPQAANDEADQSGAKVGRRDGAKA